MARDAHARRRGRHRLGDDQRPAGLRLLPGLHRLRRVALGDPRREDLQGHGHGDAERRAGDRAERLGRRAHPGGRRLARRLRRRLPAQHHGLGGDPADQRHHGALRRRRGLFAGDDRLHLHGARLVLHVRDRARRGEDGDERGRHRRGARRGEDPHHEVVGGGRGLRERPRRADGGAPARRLPAAVEPRAAAGAAVLRLAGADRRQASTRWCRRTRTRPTT